ncbi:MAG TPA: FecR domain-containing protein, partial [Oscillatoriaceae cyanobacterium]
MNRRLIPLTPLLALALLVGAIQSRAHADAAGPAQLTSVEGPVGVRLPNKTAFEPGQVGEWLPAGTILRTGLHGKAGLHWSNGGDFVLEPLGELDIQDPNDTRVDAGQVWARYTHKLLAPFSFQTPSATAVVRGTILGVRVDGLGVSRVTVFRGLVEVSDA